MGSPLRSGSTIAAAQEHKCALRQEFPLLVGIPLLDPSSLGRVMRPAYPRYDNMDMFPSHAEQEVKVTLPLLKLLDTQLRVVELEIQRSSEGILRHLLRMQVERDALAHSHELLLKHRNELRHMRGAWDG